RDGEIEAHLAEGLGDRVLTELAREVEADRVALPGRLSGRVGLDDHVVADAHPEVAQRALEPGRQHAATVRIGQRVERDQEVASGADVLAYQVRLALVERALG